MVNSNKIKGRIVELGLTQKDIAMALGIAPPTISQKINNIRSMDVREAFVIAEILKISDKEFREYFFKEEIAWCNKGGQAMKEISREKQAARITDKGINVMFEYENRLRAYLTVLSILVSTTALIISLALLMLRMRL